MLQLVFCSLESGAIYIMPQLEWYSYNQPIPDLIKTGIVPEGKGQLGTGQLGTGPLGPLL
jgi:hypothetical protein